jgi:hypothetical protein
MLKSPLFQKYDNTRFYGFFTDLLKLLDRINDEGLKTHLQPLRDTTKALDAGYKLDRDNLLTIAVKETDKKRDRALSGIYKTIEAQSFHYEDARVAAAALIERNLKKYGNVTRIAYPEESAAVNSMLADWEAAELKTAFEILNLTDWVNYLQTTQKEFDEIYLDRVQSEAAQTAIPISKLRPDATKVFQNFAMLLTVFAQITPATYLPIVEQVNELIQKYNTIAVTTKGSNTEDTETSEV